jgi:hypothetical protein
MRTSEMVVSLGAVVIAFLTMTSAANECPSIRFSGHLNRKSVQGGGRLKVQLEAKNRENKDVSNVNIRLRLPPGTQYAGSSVLPKIKSYLKPLNISPNIYWTEMTLRKKKTQKFDIQVKDHNAEKIRV